VTLFTVTKCGPVNVGSQAGNSLSRPAETCVRRVRGADPEDTCLYFVDHAAQAVLHLIGFLAQWIVRAGAVVPSVIAKVRRVQRIRLRRATVKGKTADVI